MFLISTIFDIFSQCIFSERKHQLKMHFMVRVTSHQIGFKILFPLFFHFLELLIVLQWTLALHRTICLPRCVTK